MLTAMVRFKNNPLRPDGRQFISLHPFTLSPIRQRGQKLLHHDSFQAWSDH